MPQPKRLSEAGGTLSHSGYTPVYRCVRPKFHSGVFFGIQNRFFCANKRNGFCPAGADTHPNLCKTLDRRQPPAKCRANRPVKFPLTSRAASDTILKHNKAGTVSSPHAAGAGVNMVRFRRSDRWMYRHVTRDRPRSRVFLCVLNGGAFVSARVIKSMRRSGTKRCGLSPRTENSSVSSLPGKPWKKPRRPDWIW